MTERRAALTPLIVYSLLGRSKPESLGAPAKRCRFCRPRGDRRQKAAQIRTVCRGRSESIFAKLPGPFLRSLPHGVALLILCCALCVFVATTSCKWVNSLGKREQA